MKNRHPTQWKMMASGLNEFARAGPPEDLWANRSRNKVQILLGQGEANVYAGRSVPVNHGDLSYARNKLGQTLSINKVFHTFRMQKYHEKKGYKRRRLRSERWRKRFGHEVRMKIKLVNEIRNRSNSTR